MDSWWVLRQWNEHPVLPIATAVWVIGSIVLHELAHGWAALRFGDPTPRETGHMTLNPLVHMGQMSLIMFALVGIAWGAMPINPSRMRGRYAPVLVALAGPMMNVLLFALAVVLTAVWIGLVKGAWGVTPVRNPLAENCFLFLYRGVVLNIALAIFNMLPVPPLDGFRILSGLVPAIDRLWRSEGAQSAAAVLFIMLFFFAGDIIWPAGYAAADSSIGFAIRILGARGPTP